MFRTMFADIKGARLPRLPYFGYSVLLTVLLLVIMFAAVAGVVGTESLADGNIAEIQQRFAEKAGGPTLVILLLSMLALLFAHFNLMAKRVRDIGFPGWPGVLVIFVVSAIAGSVVAEQYASLVNTIVWLALVLIPGGAFGNGGAARASGEPPGK